jgi:hypothetical protein
MHLCSTTNSKFLLLYSFYDCYSCKILFWKHFRCKFSPLTAFQASTIHIWTLINLKIGYNMVKHVYYQPWKCSMIWLCQRGHLDFFLINLKLLRTLTFTIFEIVDILSTSFSSTFFPLLSSILHSINSYEIINDFHALALKTFQQ